MVTFYEVTANRKRGVLFTGPLTPPVPDAPVQVQVPAPGVGPEKAGAEEAAAAPGVVAPAVVLPGRIPVDWVLLNRIHGPLRRVGKCTVASLVEAERVLADWSRDAPHTGFEYHLVDFLVRFSDGTAHAGLYRLRQNEQASLSQYIRDLFRFCSGTLMPDEIPRHLTPKRYELMLRRFTLSQRLACLEFLEQYEV